MCVCGTAKHVSVDCTIYIYIFSTSTCKCFTAYPRITVSDDGHSGVMFSVLFGSKCLSPCLQGKLFQFF